MSERVRSVVERKQRCGGLDAVAGERDEHEPAIHGQCVDDLRRCKRVLHDDRRLNAFDPDDAAEVLGVGVDEEADVLRHVAAEQQPDAPDEQICRPRVSAWIVDRVRPELAEHADLEFGVLTGGNRDLRRGRRHRET